MLKYTMALCAALCLALTACHAKSSDTPPVAAVNMSGDYTGTMSDTLSGNGTATATFAQKSSTLGGAVTETLTSSTLTANMALAVASPNNTVSGTMVINYPGAATCSFSVTGTFDTNALVMSGTYTPLTGCTGDSGSFSLTQQCTDTVTAVKRETGPVTPC